MKHISILTVCGFGVGSSLILKIKVDEVLRNNGIDHADVSACDVTTASSESPDIIFTSEPISKQLGTVNCPVVIIDDFINTEEIEKKGLGKIKELMGE